WSPFLHHLRPWLPRLVRRLLSYYATIRLPALLHQGLTTSVFSSRPAARRSATPRSLQGGASSATRGRPRDLPLLSLKSFLHARVPRPRGLPRRLALAPPAAWPSAQGEGVGTPIYGFRGSLAGLHDPYRRFAAALASGRRTAQG